MFKVIFDSVPKVCKFPIDYFCHAIFKNELLWNSHTLGDTI